MVAPGLTGTRECWSGFVRRAARRCDDARYRRRIICHAITGTAGGVASIVATNHRHRAAITRRIGGAKGERVATVCAASSRRETPRAVAIVRGTDGRGITVKIDINRRACPPRPFRAGVVKPLAARLPCCR